jgi:hypothetical protein
MLEWKIKESAETSCVGDDQWAVCGKGALLIALMCRNIQL